MRRSARGIREGFDKRYWHALGFSIGAVGTLLMTLIGIGRFLLFRDIEDLVLGAQTAVIAFVLGLVNSLTIDYDHKTGG